MSERISPKGAGSISLTDASHALMKGSAIVNDPLRPVPTIIGNTKRIIISQVLLPSLKRLKELEQRGTTHLSKDEFFNLINDVERKEENTLVPPIARVVEELGSTIGAIGSAVARGVSATKTAITNISLSAEERRAAREQAEAEERAEAGAAAAAPPVLTDEQKRFDEAKGIFWAAVVAMLNVDPVLGVRCADLIELCNACSVSPVATRAQREIIIRELEKFRLDEIITRNDFIVYLRRWAQQPGNDILNALDFEPYTLYVFPDMHMQVRVLRHLIYKTGSPSEHHAFASSYAKIKTVQAKDMTEFLWYLPFVVIYVIIAVSGKSITPRAYHGYNINKAFVDTVYGANFGDDCVRTYDAGLGTTVESCDGEITFAGIADASDTYTFLHSMLVPSLWPETGTAANGTLGALRVVGALKLRAMRVKGESNDTQAQYLEEYFGVNASLLPAETRPLQYPIFSEKRMNKDPDNRLAGLNLRPIVGRWDGSRFGTCDQLNGSGYILGDYIEYPCSGHAVVIPFNSTRAEVQKLIFDLETVGWIDVTTRAVLVELFLFHPVTTMLLQERMAIEFHPGGGVTTKTASRPFQFYTFATNAPAIEALYVFFIIYLFTLVLRMVIRTAFGQTLNKKLGRKWLFLDIVQYGIFLAHFALRAGWMYRGAPEDPVWQVDHYPYQYENTSRVFFSLLNLDTFNLILIILTAFRFTKYIPGLDVVVNTLSRSVYDGAAIAFVTIGVFMSFVLCAHSVYGTTLFGYHTIGYTIESLGLAFLGEFAFWPLQAEHPGFSYLFFAAFQIMTISILLNMVVAVFADAFGDEQDESFNFANARAIMDNNTFHVLKDTSMTTYFNRSYLLQTLRAKFQRFANFVRGRREDLFLYDNYHLQLMMDVRRLLIPLFVLGREGEIEDYEVDWRNRVISASNLLELVDGYLRSPRFTTQRRVDQGVGTSVYEYFNDVFGWYDYTLVMAFYVLIPQVKFSIPGDAAIMEAAATHKKWQLKVESKTMKGDEIDEVDLRVHATLEERKTLSAMANGDAASDAASLHEVAESPTMQFVNTMDHVSRRTLLGLMAYSTDEERTKTLDLALFSRLLQANPHVAKGRDFFAEELFQALNLDVEGAPALHVGELHRQMIAEFAQQALAFHWNYDRVEHLEALLAERQGGSASQRAKDVEEGVAEASHSGGGLPPALDIVSESFQAREGESIDFTHEEFVETWTEIVGSKPSKATVSRVKALFPEKVSMIDFLLHCRGNPSAHSHRSFGYQFAADQRQGNEFLLWLVFYVPFFALIVFFLLYGYQLGDSIHITQLMRAHFAAEPVTNRAEVEQYLRKTVDTMWEAGANEPATLFRRSNYFVGAVRIRQKRVTTEPLSRCERNFNQYFGDFATRMLAMPPYINDSVDARTFYDRRVRNDFGDLFAGKCYGAFDFGLQEDEMPMKPTIAASINDLTPYARDAFRFLTDGDHDSSDPVEGHDAIFGKGGYSLVIPFNWTQTRAKAVLDEVLTNGWIDDKTRLIIVEFFVFNYNLMLYGKLRFGYELTGGGSIHSLDENAVFGSEAISGSLWVALLVIFIILLIIYAIVFLMAIAKAFLERRHYFGDNVVKSLIYGLFSKWTLPVDLIIIATLAAALILRARNATNLSDIKGIDNEGRYPVPLESVGLGSQNIRKIEGTNIVFTFLRVLYFFHFNKRIGMLFDTLAFAARDLISIAALFITCLCAFALGGYVLFGYSVDLYFNFQGAIFDLFITATGGNPSYVDLAAARPQAAAVFNFFFVIVCVYILYNMVIAVLTGSFSEVKDRIYDDSVAASVIKQEQGSNWYPKKGSWARFKRFIRHNVIVNEFVHLFNFLRYKGRVPYFVTNRNPRVLWTNMSTWFGQIDTGLPDDAVFAGLQVLRLVNFDERRYVELASRHAQQPQQQPQPTEATAPAAAEAAATTTTTTATTSADDKPGAPSSTEAAAPTTAETEVFVAAEGDPAKDVDGEVLPPKRAPSVEDIGSDGDNVPAIDLATHESKQPDGGPGSRNPPASATPPPPPLPQHKPVSTAANAAPSESSPVGSDSADGGAMSVRTARAVAERKVMVDMGKKLRTYSDRRLPMWEEYIFYVFKESKEEVLRYLVQTPSRLTAEPEPQLWMAALESFHYYNAERDLYNVDVSSRLQEIYNNLPDVNEMRILTEKRK